MHDQLCPLKVLQPPQSFYSVLLAGVKAVKTTMLSDDPA